MQERNIVDSILRTYPEEFVEHIELGRCPRPRVIPVPKILDIDGTRVVYDGAYADKSPN